MKRKSYNTRKSYRPTPGRKRPWLLKGKGERGGKRERKRTHPVPFRSLAFPRLRFIPKLCRDFVLSDSSGERILKDEGGLIYPGIIPGSRIIRVLVLFQWASPPVDLAGYAWAMKNVRPCEKYDDKRGMKRTEKGQRRRSRLQWLIVAPGIFEIGFNIANQPSVCFNVNKFRHDASYRPLVLLTLNAFSFSAYAFW